MCLPFACMFGAGNSPPFCSLVLVPSRHCCLPPQLLLLLRHRRVPRVLVLTPGVIGATDLFHPLVLDASLFFAFPAFGRSGQRRNIWRFNTSRRAEDTRKEGSPFR